MVAVKAELVVGGAAAKMTPTFVTDLGDRELPCRLATNGSRA